MKQIGDLPYTRIRDKGPSPPEFPPEEGLVPPPKPPTGAPRTICFSLRCLSNQIRRVMDNCIPEGEEGHLTGTQFAVISYILNQGEDEALFQRDIETTFNIRRSSATLLLQRMERDGLLHREPVAGDLRLKRIVLTDRARQAHEQGIARIQALEERVCRNLSERERQELLRTLEKIEDNL